MNKVTAKSYSIKRDEGGKLKELNFELRAKDYLLFTLGRLYEAINRKLRRTFSLEDISQTSPNVF